MVQPTLVAVRQLAEVARQEALAKSTPLSTENLEEWSRLLMNKVLHAPSVALRQQGSVHLPTHMPLQHHLLPPAPIPITVEFSSHLDWAM